jgi:hypothetical protein
MAFECARSAARTHSKAIYCKLPPLGNTGGKKNNFYPLSKLGKELMIIKIYSKLGEGMTYKVLATSANPQSVGH